MPPFSFLGVRVADPRGDLLQAIADTARRVGLGDEGAKVAVAIALTEGALDGQVGDEGQSWGPFQFHARGMLPAFANAIGTTVAKAGEAARREPLKAVEWALRGYLGQAIKQGMQQGLRGAELATFAQRNGQRSVTPEKAGVNYEAQFGGGGGGEMKASPMGNDEPPHDSRVADQGPRESGARVPAGATTRVEAAGPGALLLRDLEAVLGPVKSVVVRDPEIETDVFDEAMQETRKTKQPNPNPTYRHIFNDGSYIDIQVNPDPTKQVIKGGTAMAKAAAADKANEPKGPQPVTAPANQPYIVSRDENGKLVYEDNRNYKPDPSKDPPTPIDKWETVYDPTTKKPIKLRDPATGTTIDLPDPKDAATPKYVTVNGRVYKETPAGLELVIDKDPEKPAKPTVVNTSSSEPYIVYSDGTKIENPNYVKPAKTVADLQAEATARKQELWKQYQAGTITYAQVFETYNEWADAQGKMLEYEQQRQAAAQSRATTMVNAEISDRANRVGPTFGAEMAGAISAIGEGGPVNFSPGSFTYNAPSLRSIAEQQIDAMLAKMPTWDKVMAAPAGAGTPPAQAASAGFTVPAPASAGAPPAQPWVPPPMTTRGMPSSAPAPGFTVPPPMRRPGMPGQPDDMMMAG